MRGIVDESTLTSGIVEDEIADIDRRQQKAHSGLLEFGCIPEGLKGLDLLNHQVVFRKRPRWAVEVSIGRMRSCAQNHHA